MISSQHVFTESKFSKSSYFTIILEVSLTTYPPYPWVYISDFITWFAPYIDLEHIITLAPAKANALQVSNPIPEFPPVTMAVLPFKNSFYVTN